MGLPAIAGRQSDSKLPLSSALAFIRRVAQVSLAATWERIDVTATRGRFCPAAINASGWQRAPVNCLGENARDFLRQRAMFPSCQPAQRLLQLVWHVGANENSLAIGHLFSMSPCEIDRLLGKF